MCKWSVSKWRRARAGRRAARAARRAAKEEAGKGSFGMEPWFSPRVRQGFAASLADFSIQPHGGGRKPVLTWCEMNKLCYRKVVALFLKGKKDYVWDSRQWRVVKEIKEELCSALEKWVV